MERIKSLIRFVVFNFGPLIVFYLINHQYGLKSAIVATIVATLIEILWFRARKKQMTPLFLFSAGVALIFGTLDLLLEDPVFFKYEAGLINLLFAVFFGVSLLRPKSLIQELAEQQGRTSREQSLEKDQFFRLLTGAWVFYFLAKAIAYVIINQNFSIEDGLWIRMIVGNLSFAAMMVFSIMVARPLWNLFRRARSRA